MSVAIISDTGGLLTAKVTGTLTRPELATLQDAAIGVIRRQGKVRILVLVEDFQGWAKNGDWDDVSFMENDPYIEKMAIVGDRRWEELAYVFTAKWLRKFPIEYFPPGEVEAARAWLAGD